MPFAWASTLSPGNTKPSTKDLPVRSSWPQPSCIPPAHPTAPPPSLPLKHSMQSRNSVVLLQVHNPATFIVNLVPIIVTRQTSSSSHTMLQFSSLLWLLFCRHQFSWPHSHLKKIFVWSSNLSFQNCATTLLVCRRFSLAHGLSYLLTSSLFHNPSP